MPSNTSARKDLPRGAPLPVSTLCGNDLPAFAALAAPRSCLIPCKSHQGVDLHIPSPFFLGHVLAQYF